MATSFGKTTKILVDQFNVRSFLNAWDSEARVDEVDSTTFGESGHRVQGTLAGGRLTLVGFFDGDAGASDPSLAPLRGGANVAATVWPEDDVLGNRAVLLSGQAAYHTSGRVGQLTVIRFPITSDDGLWHGRSAHALTARTTTANGSSFDDGAAPLTPTTAGAIASLHVTAVSGTTPSLTAKIQHSTDNVTFVDLITFTAKTAIGAEVKSTAAGVTVNRYIRASWTITGTTPSFTFAMAFARKF